MNQMQDFEPPAGGPRQPLPTAADPKDCGASPLASAAPVPRLQGAPSESGGGAGARDKASGSPGVRPAGHTVIVPSKHTVRADGSGRRAILVA